MIYLVDDDEIQNLINTKVVEIVAPHVKVKAFTAAEVALKMLTTEEAKPSLIFLDINMPKLNGWDFLDAYLKLDLPVKVYMLSSSINHKDILKSKQYEIVNGFISKPLVVERLSEVLQDEGLL